MQRIHSIYYQYKEYIQNRTKTRLKFKVIIRYIIAVCFKSITLISAVDKFSFRRKGWFVHVCKTEKGKMIRKATYQRLMKRRKPKAK